MRSQTRLLRLGAWLASSSLTMAALFPAHAQPAPPAGAEQAGEPNADPPALAGRLAAVTGSVSFHSAEETQWSAATLNYPVTNGEAFWTEPQAQATLEVADDRIVLDSSTELDVGAIDASQIVMTEAQGAIFVHLNSLQPNQSVTFNTPRGAVQITAPGRYEIVAGDTNDATMVTVVEGAARVTGTNLTLDIGPQQTATIGGSDTLQGAVGPIQRDAFLQSMLRGPARRHYASSVPRQVQYMTGAADLETYGRFSQSAQYGQVWYPNDVPRAWAPYRDGHWSYVQPWGWTWVDNARWGFAPFHYGRWVEVDNRWGWVAGENAEVSTYPSYPVYSPALVSFVDVGGAALAGAAIGFAAGSFAAGAYAPAWIPLGPREPYYPWYRTRADYFDRVNRPYGVPQAIIERGPTYINNVRNTTIVNNTTVNNVRNVNQTVFINQRAATVVPAGAFARGQSMASYARPLPVSALANARPVIGRLPVAPTAETPNLPRAAASRYNVALPAHPVRSATAGPRIEAPTGQPRPVPALRQAPPPAGTRPVPATQVRGLPAPGVGGPGGQGPRGTQVQPGQPGVTPRPGPGALPRPAGGALPRPAGGDVPRPAGGGPQIGPRAQGGLPALRAPGGRPEIAPRPGNTVPTAAGRPAAQGGQMRPGPAAAPQVNRPGGAAPAPQSPARPELRPGSAAGPGTPHAATAAPRLPPVRPAPQVGAPRPAPRVDAPRPLPRPQAQPPIQRAPAPAPVPHVQAARPMPRIEAPRPPPRMEAPRPQPRMEATRPQPRMEAPRPQPRMEAPRPPPRMEAPRPSPPPRPAPTRPAPPPPHPGPQKPQPGR